MNDKCESPNRRDRSTGLDSRRRNRCPDTFTALAIRVRQAGLGYKLQDPYRCRSTVLPTPAACELMGGAYTRRPYHELRLHPSSCLAAGGAGVPVVAHDPHETAASRTRVDVVSSRRDGILMPSGFDTVQASEQ